jgi:L-threonylcarbamoyladenylate synthase
MSMGRYIWGSSEAYHVIKKTFEAGKAILAESDTVWGLFIPATQAGALVLDRLKRRRDKPYLVIIDSLESAQRMVVFADNGSLTLAQKGWPGPLTLLCKAREGQLIDAQHTSGVVGVRVPNHKPMCELAQEYGGLFSTSANISGQLGPISYDQIDSSILHSVGAMVYNDVMYKSSLIPTTIVDCTGTELKVVRQGAYGL